MSVLLAPDECAIYPPAQGSDEHGWRLGPEVGDTALWVGRGNLQMGAGISGVDAAQSGGHGPFDPNSLGQGEVYLPADCGVYDGCVLISRDKAYTVAFTRLVPDPRARGHAGCVVASVSEVEQWQPASL